MSTQGLKLDELYSWFYLLITFFLPDENRSGHGLTGRSGCYSPDDILIGFINDRYG